VISRVARKVYATENIRCETTTNVPCHTTSHTKKKVPEPETKIYHLSNNEWVTILKKLTYIDPASEEKTNHVPCHQTSHPENLVPDQETKICQLSKNLNGRRC
jgi:hypothetical protein